MGSEQSFAELFFQAVEGVKGGGRVNESGGDGDGGPEGGDGGGGWHSRPNGPPAGHSVIHKMRLFSQTTLYRPLSCGSYMQLGRESSAPSAFR